MKIYAEVLEQTALDQFNSAMSLDFVVDGALMPDAHTGYALPIGAAIATNGVVVPSWVGYDIGCGMCALKLVGVTAESIRLKSKQIFDLVYKKIPVGFSINSNETDYSDAGLTVAGKQIANKKQYKKALGTLGGGNHFIEIGSDESGNAWIVIHSGSRGVGHAIATHYMKLANPEGKAKDGHWGFDVESEEGANYIQDLNWALDYALANRKEMIYRVVGAVAESVYAPNLQDVQDWDSLINRNHNHAVLRDGLWIHRKGATHAEEGMMGVIPGNMRDGSFIVRGKGNPDSLYSSSHGAGRVMGRKQAKRELDLVQFQDDLSGVTALVSNGTLDESPRAYKNIFEVMELQKDLVDVVAHIKPIVNIKG